jgi:hypothetical protein
VFHNVNVYLSGAFSSDATLDKHIKYGCYVNIDGGDGYDIINGPLNLGSAPTDSDFLNAGSTTNYIYKGRWLYVINGKNADFIRTIRHNQTNTIDFQRTDMGGSASGDDCNIIMPSTRINNLKIACSGLGSIIVQHIFINTGYKIWSEGCDASIILTMIQSFEAQSASQPVHDFENCRKVRFESRPFSNGEFDSSPNVSAGVNIVGNTQSNISTRFVNVKDVSMSCVHLDYVQFINCGIGLINDGSFFKYRMDIVASNSIGGDPIEPHSFEDTPGYDWTNKLGFYNEGTDYGLNLYQGSKIGVKNLDINSATRSIAVYGDSCLSVVTNGILTGSANGSGGVNVWDGGVVCTAHGAQPITIIGSSSEIYMSFDVGDWADIQINGVPEYDSALLTLAGEYESPGDIFKVFDFTNDENLPSISNMDFGMTINQLTVYPTFLYNAKDATIASWPARDFGSNISIAGSGDDVLINQGSPLIGSDDDSVQGAGNKYFQLSDSSIYDITTEDFMFTVVVQKGTVTSGRIIDKRGASGAGYYLTEENGSSQITLYIEDGSSNSASINSPTLIDNAWYVLNYFVDKSGSGICYANTNAGSAAVVSSVGSMTNSENFTIFADSDGNNDGYSKIAFLGMWEKASWLNSHLQVTLDKEIFHKITGSWPQAARGTETPTVCVRDTKAYLQNNENFHLVGEDWMRVEHTKDAYGNDFKGCHIEDGAENKCLQSEDKSTTWSKLNAGDTISSNQTADPAGNTTLDAIIGDSTDGIHGFSQAVTVTAVKWVYSEIMKVGNKDWGYLANTTVANCYSYFDLSTGVVGTEGAGASAGIIDLGGGLYRCFITFTGTAASHTFQCASAHADTDNDFSGDGSTKNTYFGWSQIELGEYPSSYVPTTSSAVTRNADQLYYKGDDGNVAASETGTVLCNMLRHISTPVGSDDDFIFTLSDGGSSGDIITLSVDASRKLLTYVEDAGGPQVNDTGTKTISTGQPETIMVAFKNNNVSSWVNDYVEALDTTCTITDNIDRISIGGDYQDANQLNGWFNNFRIRMGFCPR